MNVRFFGGHKEEYVSIPKHNPIGLYFCADTRELFWGDWLLSDGIRIVPTYDDLPSISDNKAAEGVIYFVESTRNGYVLPSGRSEWLQVIYAPSSQDADLSNYYTQAEVDEAILTAIANINFPKTDLTGYAKEDWVNNQGFLKEIPAEYITEAELAAKGYLTSSDISNKADKDHTHPEYITNVDDKADVGHTHTLSEITDYVVPEIPSLDDYAKKTELFSKSYNDLTDKPVIPSVEGLASEEYVNGQIQGINIPKIPTNISAFTNDVGYLTEHQDLSEYAKKDELFSKDYNDLINKPTGLATEEYVDNAVSAIEHPTVNLDNYVTKDEISGFISEIPEEYITETELDAKGYLTNHQDISGKADKSEVTAAIASAIADKADNKPFTTAKFVTKAVGGFIEGEDISSLTIAQLFAKLLELSDEKPGTDEPEIPQGIVESIITNEIPMYAVTPTGAVETIPYQLLTYDESTAAAKPTTSGFYQITKADGTVESGYQQISAIYLDMPYLIALPKAFDFASNVEVQSWNDIEGVWEADEITKDSMSSDIQSFIDVVGTSPYELYPNIDADKYTFWFNLEVGSTGIIYRFIINE